MRSIGNREGPRLDFLFCQARLAFASFVAYSRINSTLLLLQGAESIGAYAWRFDDGSPLFTSCRVGLFSETQFPVMSVLGNSEGMKRAGAVRDPGPIVEAVFAPLP